MGVVGCMVLIDVGVKLFGVFVDSCKVEKGFVILGNKKISYGDIVVNGKVDKIFSVDEFVELLIKLGKKCYFIGVNVDYKVFDILFKINGIVVYGIDVEVENMFYVCFILFLICYGSIVINVDDSKVKSLLGYKGYKVFIDLSGIIEGWVIVLVIDYFIVIKVVDMVKVSYNVGKIVNVFEVDI